MNLKASKRGFKKEKHESKRLCSLLHHQLSWQFIVALDKKVSGWGGGLKHLETSIS